MYIDSRYIVQHYKRKSFSTLDKSILKKIKNLDLTEGIIVTKYKKNKKPLSLLSYFNSVFPYNFALEGHIEITSDKNKFSGILSILASLIIALNENKKKKYYY